jgi:hypothetical protein
MQTALFVSASEKRQVRTTARRVSLVPPNKMTSANMTTTDLSPLFNSSQTFSATSIQLSTIPSTDQFHLLFRLVDFLNSPETADPSTTHNYEDWMTARMKAEWCLWEGYSKWDIGLNPFLGHFVEFWEQRYTQENVTPDILVVGIILSGQAKEVRHKVKVTNCSWQV